MICAFMAMSSPTIRMATLHFSSMPRSPSRGPTRPCRLAPCSDRPGQDNAPAERPKQEPILAYSPPRYAPSCPCRRRLPGLQHCSVCECRDPESSNNMAMEACTVGGRAAEGPQEGAGSSHNWPSCILIVGHVISPPWAHPASARPCLPPHPTVRALITVSPPMPGIATSRMVSIHAYHSRCGDPGNRGMRRESRREPVGGHIRTQLLGEQPQGGGLYWHVWIFL
jgi:hypothetical protein